METYSDLPISNPDDISVSNRDILCTVQILYITKESHKILSDSQILPKVKVHRRSSADTCTLCKMFGPRSGRTKHYVGPDMDTNCLTLRRYSSK